jgi:hypothetical protein
MHEKELDRATTEVASSIDISGQATAAVHTTWSSGVAIGSPRLLSAG